ncbi:MAG: ASCH domain-containing protein [Candidatus Rokuibacteriota bacterium]
MASGTSRVAALMSLHPEFAHLILEGRKRVEFRKRRFAETVTHVVIYATGPVKQILGFFEVSRLREDTPENLWNRYKRRGGIARNAFSAYYKQSRTGVAIEVGRVFRLPNPLDLSEVNPTAPQSFVYISQRTISELTRLVMGRKNGSR